MSPSHLYKNGKLITRDVGEYSHNNNFLNTWLQGSSRLGTPFNDIRTRNVGNNNLIFDPSKTPIHQTAESIAAGSLLATIINKTKENQLSQENCQCQNR
jgi:hypothetical protein